MATTTSYNKRSSAVKRILSEAREMRQESTSEYAAAPLEDNLFEWHFTLRGPSSSDFEEGIYHGRIMLPPEYPFRPPDVMFLTPNGRWELNKKICLTFTGFHEEMWQPAWGIRTALVAVQAYMGIKKAKDNVGIASLNFPPEERMRLAKVSGEWKCPICEKTNREQLPRTNDTRVQESLPDGLCIDPNADKDKGQGEAANGMAAQSAADTNGRLEQSNVQFNDGAPSVFVSSAKGSRVPADSVQESPSNQSAQASSNTFGAEGPSNELLARLVEDAHAQQHASFDTSQASTPDLRSNTLLDHTLAEQDRRANGLASQATDRERSQSPSNIQQTREPSAAASTSSSIRAVSANASVRPALPQQPAGHTAPLPPAAAVLRAPPGREEVESVRRLAALDRAIATVICLLLALFVRRVLNAW